MNDAIADLLLARLLALGDAIRDAMLRARPGASTDEWSEVAEVTAADTIYRVDRVGEAAIQAWFDAQWPADHPVELVMEGIPDDAPWTFPRGTAIEATRWKCILDPIDGTRNLMFDKRSAWALAAIAPQRGAQTGLADIIAAAMTEIPTTKAWRADRFGAVRGRGPHGIVAEACNVLTGGRTSIGVRPSGATDFRHGFASFVRFFPEGLALTARLEEDFWERLGLLGSEATPLVFNDQYLTTGGQIHEMLAGRDRMLADLRPLVLPRVGQDASLACHPYDICTAMILEEAGGIIEAPDGGPLEAPLNTTTPVAWVAFANRNLASVVRPVLHAVLSDHGLLHEPK